MVCPQWRVLFARGLDDHAFPRVQEIDWFPKENTTSKFPIFGFRRDWITTHSPDFKKLVGFPRKIRLPNSKYVGSTGTEPPLDFGF